MGEYQDGSYYYLWDACLCPLQDRDNDHGGAGAGVQLQGGGSCYWRQQKTRIPGAAYLVNKYGKDDKLYPRDAELRARVDQRLYFDMGTFYPAVGDCMYPIMFGGPLPGNDKFEKLKEVLGWVEGFVADNKFAAGTDWITIGDISLLATYSTVKEAGLGDLQNYPNMKTWFEKCCKLIPNYQVANGNGAEEFGTYYKTAGKR